MFEGCPHHQLYEEGGEVGPHSEVRALHCLLLWVVNLFKEAIALVLFLYVVS